MITPIRALNIREVCKRMDDLLVSSDDIKEMARNERAKTIDEFAEKLCDAISEQYTNVEVNGIKFDVLTVDGITEIAWDLAEQLKGE